MYKNCVFAARCCVCKYYLAGLLNCRSKHLKIIFSSKYWTVKTKNIYKRTLEQLKNDWTSRTPNNIYIRMQLNRYELFWDALVDANPVASFYPYTRTLCRPLCARARVCVVRVSWARGGVRAECTSVRTKLGLGSYAIHKRTTRLVTMPRQLHWLNTHTHTRAPTFTAPIQPWRFARATRSPYTNAAHMHGLCSVHVSIHT